MKSMLKGLLAALLIAGSSSVMAATIADEIVLTTGQYFVYSSTPLDDSDYTVLVPIHFLSDGHMSIATASVVPNNLESMTLYSSNSDYSVAIDPVSFGALESIGNAGNDSFYNWALSAFLTQGHYLLELVGSGPGSVHGSVSAVPLPGAAFLFGTALLGAGVVGRRKVTANRAEAIAA